MPVFQTRPSGPSKIIVSVGLSLSFVPFADRLDSPFCAGERLALEHRRSRSLCRSNPGTCHPLRPRGDSHRFVPALRSQHSFRHVMNASALPTFLQIHFTQGRHLLRPVKLLAPCADLTSFVAAEAFTSMLSTNDYGSFWTVPGACKGNSACECKCQCSGSVRNAVGQALGYCSLDPCFSRRVVLGFNRTPAVREKMCQLFCPKLVG